VDLTADPIHCSALRRCTLQLETGLASVACDGPFAVDATLNRPPENLKLSEFFCGKLRQIVPNTPGVRQHQFSLAPAISDAGLA
jgi:hypothetical protein